MDSGQDFFLEALCLGICGGKEARAVTKAAIAIYDEQVTIDPQLQDRIIKLYVKMLRDINNDVFDVDDPADVAKYLLKFEHHPLVEQKPELYQNLKKIFENKQNISIRKINKMTTDVKNWVILTRISASNRKMYGLSQQYSSSTDEMKQEVLINEILQCAKDLNNKCNVDLDSLANNDVVEMIDLGDRASLTKGFTALRHKRGGKVWKSGLQGLNRLMGPAGGIAPGEFVVFAALSHHYKSGILKDYARWIAKYNKPGNTHGRIPVIAHFSLENEVSDNLASWYKSDYVNVFGKEADMNISMDVMIDQVTSSFGVNGFRLIAFRELGETFGFDQYVEKIERLEAAGFKVLVSIIDYLTLMNAGKNTETNDAKRIQQLFHKVANFGKHRNMTQLTGIQLDGKAEELAGSTTNAVKKFCGAHLAECKGIKREADILVFMHIEQNHLGVPYLTIKKNKHREVNDTKPEDLYTAYRFTPTGIMDDIGGEDASVTNIYDEIVVKTESMVF